MSDKKKTVPMITATKRLNQDYLKIKKDPVPYISAEPLPSNILEWHYIVRGPEGTLYEGGYYHDFHPDTWNPVWSVSTILTALLSFMVGNDSTFGSMNTSDATKRQLSAQSLAFDLKDKVFCELFPDVVDELKQKLKEQEELSARTKSLPLPGFQTLRSWCTLC